MARNNVLCGGQPAAELRDLEASGTITPGELVEFTGDTETVQRHSQAAAKTAVMVAGIVPYSGDPEDGTMPLDDDYADGDYVKVVVPDVGNRCNLVASESISVGDALVSAGDGTVRTLDTSGGDTQGAVLFQARESAAADEHFVAERI